MDHSLKTLCMILKTKYHIQRFFLGWAMFKKNMCALYDICVQISMTTNTFMGLSISRWHGARKTTSWEVDLGNIFFFILYEQIQKMHNSGSQGSQKFRIHHAIPYCIEHYPIVSYISTTCNWNGCILAGLALF